MPFKSEKQRRYLWANEPEIARDWTDTYGSRVEAALGGIMRLGLAFGGTGGRAPGVGGNSADRGGNVQRAIAQRAIDTASTRSGDGHANRGWQTYAIGPTTTSTKGGEIDQMLNRKFETKPKGFFGGLGSWAGKLRGWNEKYGRYNTQKEYNTARQQRIANQRIQNILGRTAPITGLMQTRLRDLGYTGGLPGIGSTPTSRAIQNDPDYLSEMDTGYSRAQLQEIQNQQGIMSPDSIAHDFEGVNFNPAHDFEGVNFNDGIRSIGNPWGGPLDLIDPFGSVPGNWKGSPLGFRENLENKFGPVTLATMSEEQKEKALKELEWGVTPKNIMPKLQALDETKWMGMKKTEDKIRAEEFINFLEKHQNRKLSEEEKKEIYQSAGEDI